MKYTVFRGNGDSRQYSETGRCNSNATGSHFLDIEGKDWAVCQEGWVLTGGRQKSWRYKRHDDGKQRSKKEKLGDMLLA